MRSRLLKRMVFVFIIVSISAVFFNAFSAGASAEPAWEQAWPELYEGREYSYAVKNIPRDGWVLWAVEGEKKEFVTLSKGKGSEMKLRVKRTKGDMTAKNAKVTVTAGIYDKNNKWRKTLRKEAVIKVPVKEAVISIPQDLDLTAVPVGRKIRLGVELEPVNATGFTAWSLSAENGEAATGAAVDAKGIFYAQTPGSYRVTASIKDKKKGKVLFSTSVTVTAENGITQVKQESADRISVIFSYPAAGSVKKEDFRVTNEDFAGAPWPVKKLIFKEEGSRVSLVGFEPLEKGTKYKVEYGKHVLIFTTSSGEAESVEIQTREVMIKEERPNLDIRFYDGEGMDITTRELLEGVELVYSGDGYIDNAGEGSSEKTAVMEKPGDALTVKAVCHTGKYESDGTERILESEEVTIRAKEREPLIQKEATVYTIEEKNSGFIGFQTDSAEHRISVSDTDRKLYVRFKDKNGGAYSNQNAEQAHLFMFESSDENLLLLSEDGTLTPVKAGRVSVRVSFRGQEDGKPVYAELLPVQVTAERVLTSLETEKTVIASTLADGTRLAAPRILLRALDQFGEPIEAAAVYEITGNESTETARITLAEQQETEKGSLIYEIGNLVSEASWRIRFTASAGKKTKTAQVLVKVKHASETERAGWEIAGGPASVDLAVGRGTRPGAREAVFEIREVNREGLLLPAATPAAFELAIQAPGRDGEVRIPITGEEHSVPGLPVTIKLECGIWKVRFLLSEENEGIIHKRMNPGVYKMKVYYEGKEAASGTLLVKDSQALPEYELERITVKANEAASITELVRAAYRIEGSNENDDRIISVTYKYNGNTYETQEHEEIPEPGSYAVLSFVYQMQIGNYKTPIRIESGQTLKIREE